MISEIKSKLIRAICRIAASQEENVSNLKRNKNFQTAACVTKDIYVRTSKFLNCCVDCTSQTLARQSKAIAQDIRTEYQIALEEQKKLQHKSSETKGKKEGKKDDKDDKDEKRRRKLCEAGSPPKKKDKDESKKKSGECECPPSKKK